jgi:hypothetical protein
MAHPKTGTDTVRHMISSAAGPFLANFIGHGPCFRPGDMLFRAPSIRPIFALLLVPLIAACSSSNDAESRANVTGSGGSSGSDSGTSGMSSGGARSGTSGANNGGMQSGNSGAGGRITASGGAAGANSNGSGGSRVARDGGPCGFSSAPVAPPPVDTTASQEAQANAIGMHMLDNMIGRYLRGEATIYSGTASAHDNRSELVNSIVYGPRPDGVIPDGRALGILEVRPSIDRDWDPPKQNPSGTTSILVVHGLPPDQHYILEQHSVEPGLTIVSLLSPVATTANMATSCKSCAPDLAGRPANVSFKDLSATGPMTVYMGYTYDGGHDVNVTARVTASADLTILPPCALTFDDLVVVESASGPNEISIELSEFTQQGNEMVRNSGGNFTVGGTPMCPLVESYSIELYVDLNDLGHYGTRNFVAETPTVRCVPGTP